MNEKENWKDKLSVLVYVFLVIGILMWLSQWKNMIEGLTGADGQKSRGAMIIAGFTLLQVVLIILYKIDKKRNRHKNTKGGFVKINQNLYARDRMKKVEKYIRMGDEKKAMDQLMKRTNISREYAQIVVENWYLY